MRDVINPVIFITRCGALGVFFSAMKCRPEAAIGVTITEQQYFFRRNQRNPQRIVLKDKFVVPLAVDERSVSTAAAMPEGGKPTIAPPVKLESAAQVLGGGS